MTVAAQQAGLRLRRDTARPFIPILAGVLLGISTASEAQVGVVASVYSDYRFRGVSLSGGRPVGMIDLSYDLPSGFYAALSGRTVATKNEGLQFLGFSANGGYAYRLEPGVSADFGILHSRYSHYSGLSASRSYSEVYAGVTGKHIGARISVSPNYFGSARWAAYGEVVGHFDLSRRTTVDGAVGVLARLDGSYGLGRQPQFDTRIGIGQRVGPLTLHAAVVTGNRSYRYSARRNGPTAIVLGVSAAL